MKNLTKAKDLLIKLTEFKWNKTLEDVKKEIDKLIKNNPDYISL